MTENAMTPNEKLAYLAGLIDGEGCISTSCGTNSSVRIAVSMCTPQGPQFMAEVFGGSIRLQAMSKSAFGRRPQYRWEARACKAEVVIRALLPYLREKREQAEVALIIRDMQRGQGYKHRTAEELATLNGLRSKLSLLKKPAIA